LTYLPFCFFTALPFFPLFFFTPLSSLPLLHSYLSNYHRHLLELRVFVIPGRPAKVAGQSCRWHHRNHLTISIISTIATHSPCICHSWPANHNLVLFATLFLYACSASTARHCRVCLYHDFRSAFVHWQIIVRIGRMILANLQHSFHDALL
jgi:hypothetical protein